MPYSVIIFMRRQSKDGQSECFRSISNFAVLHSATPLSPAFFHKIGGFAPRSHERFAHIRTHPAWGSIGRGSSFLGQNVEVSLKMSPGSPRSIAELLRTGDISRLKAEAAGRRKLATEVRAALPAAEAEHVVSAHIDESDQLVISVDSPAWAARLRYSLSELMGKRLKVKTAVPRDGRDEPQSKI